MIRYIVTCGVPEDLDLAEEHKTIEDAQKEVDRVNQYIIDKSTYRILKVEVTEIDDTLSNSNS